MMEVYIVMWLKNDGKGNHKHGVEDVFLSRDKAKDHIKGKMNEKVTYYILEKKIKGE